jgi:hypothetical protein
MSKSLILMACLVVCQILCRAQVSVDPLSGKELTFGNVPGQKPDTIPTSKLVYQKPASATLKLSSRIAYSITLYLDPKKWSSTKVNDTIEFKFYRAGTQENIGMLIAEPNPSTYPAMAELAIKNAERGASDVKLIKKEYRKVNGSKMLFLQFTANISGINFTYYNYYYTGGLGTVQLLTYTITDIADKNKQDLQDLLNGLVARE